MKTLKVIATKQHNHGTDVVRDLESVPENYEKAKKKRTKLLMDFEKVRAEFKEFTGPVTGFEEDEYVAKKHADLEKRFEKAFQKWVSYQKEFLRIHREKWSREFFEHKEKQECKVDDYSDKATLTVHACTDSCYRIARILRNMKIHGDTGHTFMVSATEGKTIETELGDWDGDGASTIKKMTYTSEDGEETDVTEDK